MQLLVCVIKSRAKQRASLEILITKSRDSGRLLLLPHWVCFKADFQSVLRTLKSLFTTFVLFHVRRHKM